ncbi:MAG: carbohydrate ABC transporter permease [Clostridia bacterium]|jgi:putative aldouronate transport system permease protein|nr:carbohydrate ABC transporter permease [Clostridia bacterium]
MVKAGYRRRRIRLSAEDRVFGIVTYTLAILFMLVCAYPLIYVLSASVSNPALIVSGKIVLLPKGIQFRAYEAVFKSEDVLLGYRNAIFYAFAGTAINIVLTTAGAYVLSRPDLWGRTAITFLISFTMFFSGGMIPTYITIKNLGMINTVWAMLLPGAISATNLLIMRNFFTHSVPQEIIEAAYVDGCSNTGTLCRIVLPVSGSIIAVMVIFYFVGHWNAYFSAMIYLNDKKLYPLQVFLREILIQNQLGDMSGGADTVNQAEMTLLYEALKFAVITVATLPIMCVYPFLQRYFVKGVMIGSIKG